MDVIQEFLHEAARRAAQTQAARQSPRCHHIRSNGVRCGCPALRGRQFCYFHERLRLAPRLRALPPLEDANAIQCAIMEVTRGVLDKTLDAKTAGLLLYALQTASANLKTVDFQPFPSQVETEDIDVEDSCAFFDPEEEPHDAGPTNEDIA